ncbi:MAG: 4Fe-4S binding protein, partial [Sarcina sp.]
MTYFYFKRRNKMAYRINKDECIGCGACEAVCPVTCISEVEDGKREINEN